MILLADRRPARSSPRAATMSLVLHGLAVAVLLGTAIHPVPRLVASMPGTHAGTRLSLVYQPGGRPAPAATVVAHAHPMPRALPHSKAQLMAPAANAAAPAATAGSGSSGEASWGDANVVIAGVLVHPRPTPDLATLPAGSGNIVLDALIDETGHIARLTVERSLGASIDQQVLATVQGWTFTPATRDGTPIASEQDIVFHFDHS